jgi:hypothetical protein
MRGVGRAAFAAILLTIAGALNIIYGIAAISNADFFAGENVYVFSNVDLWGWLLLLLGIVQLTAGYSLFGGGLYGRLVGIYAASVGAIGALLSIGGQHPFWSLGIFAICLIVIHGLVVYGEPEEPRTREPRV